MFGISQPPSGTSTNNNFGSNAAPTAVGTGNAAAPANNIAPTQPPASTAAPPPATEQTFAKPAENSKEAAKNEVKQNVHDAPKELSFREKYMLFIEGRLDEKEFFEELRKYLEKPLVTTDVQGASVGQSTGGASPQGLGGFGIHSTTAPTGNTLGGFGGEQARQLGQSAVAQQLNFSKEENERQASLKNHNYLHDIIMLLQDVDSGVYNIDLKKEEFEPKIRKNAKGLNGKIAEQTPKLAKNLIEFIRAETNPQKINGKKIFHVLRTNFLSNDSNTSNILNTNGLQNINNGPKSSFAVALPTDIIGRANGIDGSVDDGLIVNTNPILLASQCLYLTTRHFHMEASFFPSSFKLLEQLFALLKNELGDRELSFRDFRESPLTASFSALLWLVTFSLVNATETWKRLYDGEGNLIPNAILRTTAPEGISTFVKECQKTFEAPVVKQFQSTKSDGILRGGRLSTNKQGHHRQNVPLTSENTLLYCEPTGFLRIMDAYLSILTFAEGCYWTTKGEDKKMKAVGILLDSLLGDRIYSTQGAFRGGDGVGANPNAYSFSSENPSIRGLRRGRAVKRIVDLAPVPQALNISIEMIYVLPNEIVSYIFDNALLLVKELSEIEQAAFSRHMEKIYLFSGLSGGNDDAQLGGDMIRNKTSGRNVNQHNWNDYSNNLGPYGLSGYPSSPYNNEFTGLPENYLITETHNFISEIPHLLEVCIISLEHLPPEVLNPDLNMDCAITYFIEVNCVQHLEAVLEMQRAYSVLWENYTLKLMSRFLDVLSVIARNQQYLQRVASLLEGVQSRVEGVTWKNLIRQAQECAGISLRDNGIVASSRTNNLEREKQQPTMEYFYRSVGALQQEIREGNYGEIGNAASDAGAEAIMLNLLPKQFSVRYTAMVRCNYIASLFLLMRQMLTHRSIRPTILKYLDLPLALTFLHAPRCTAVMTGSTLSLIAALIGDGDDAQFVWDYMEEHRFFRPQQIEHLLIPTANGMHQSNVGNHLNLSGVQSRGNFLPQSGALDPYSQNKRSANDNDGVTLSIIGHCKYEISFGGCKIAIGFLNLFIALCRMHEPENEHFSAYSSLVHFISDELFCNIFKTPEEIGNDWFTMIALAAAALRNAFGVRFGDEGTFMTFATVMSANRAPSDVVGVTIKVIELASQIGYEMPKRQTIALRQCLNLLVAAIEVSNKRNELLHPFAIRVPQNTTLVKNVLPFALEQDMLLAESALRFLLLVPSSTIIETALQYWTLRRIRYLPLVAKLSKILDPNFTELFFVEAPPELAILDVEERKISNDFISDPLGSMVRVKQLWLDLLAQHSASTDKSLTSWVVGWLEPDKFSRNFFRTPFFRVFSSILRGSSHKSVEENYPELAVKYVKLIYFLRTNKVHGGTVRLWLSERDGSRLLHSLLYFNPLKCSFNLFRKYSYLMDLLRYELTYIRLHKPIELNLDYSGVPSTPVNVLTALIKATQKQLTDVNRSKIVDVDGNDGDFPSLLQWFEDVLKSLPPLPKLNAPRALNSYLLKISEGLLQYDVPSIDSDLQRSRSATGQPLYSVEEQNVHLMPFVSANTCLLHYNYANALLQSWTKLVSFSVLSVHGISGNLLREIALQLCTAIGKIFSLSVSDEFKEQAAFTLSTVVADLCQQIEISSKEYGRGGVHHHNGAISTRENAQWNSNEKKKVPASIAITSSSTLHANTDVVKSVYDGATRDAREISNGLKRTRDGYDGAGFSKRPLSASSGLNSPAAGGNHYLTLLEYAEALYPLMYELLRCISMDRPSVDLSLARIALYRALLHLLNIPGISLGDFMMTVDLDYHKKLLQLLVGDIVNTVDEEALAGIDSQKFSAISVSQTQHRSKGTTAERSQLNELGITLLSSILRGNPLILMEQDASKWIERCIMVLLKQIDLQILQRKDSTSTLKLIQQTFDLIATWSTHSRNGFFSTSILEACFRMECWLCVPDVIADRNAEALTDFGASKYANGTRSMYGTQDDMNGAAPDLSRAAYGGVGYSAHENMGRDSRSKTMFHSAVNVANLNPSKEILARLFLNVIENFNLCSQYRFLFTSPEFIKQVQQFVVTQQTFIYTLLNEPFKSSTRKGISTFQLTLIEKITLFFRNFSDTFLVEDCRHLQWNLSLMDLLQSISQERVLYGQNSFIPDVEDGSGVNGGGIGGSTRRSRGNFGGLAEIGLEDRYRTAGPSRHGGFAGSSLSATVASEKQRAILAQSVLNLCHFMLRTEYGLRDLQLSALFHRNNGNPENLFYGGEKIRENFENVNRLVYIFTEVLRCNAHIIDISQSFRTDSNHPHYISFLELFCNVHSICRLSYLLEIISLPVNVHKITEKDGTMKFVVDNEKCWDDPKYRQYAASLPFSAFLDVLKDAQTQLNKLYQFSTDFPGAITVRKTTNGYQVESKGISSQPGSDRRAVPNHDARGPPVQGVLNMTQHHHTNALQKRTASTPLTPLLSGIGGGDPRYGGDGSAPSSPKAEASPIRNARGSRSASRDRETSDHLNNYSTHYKRNHNESVLVPSHNDRNAPLFISTMNEGSSKTIGEHVIRSIKTLQHLQPTYVLNVDDNASRPQEGNGSYIISRDATSGLNNSKMRNFEESNITFARTVQGQVTGAEGVVAADPQQSLFISQLERSSSDTTNYVPSKEIIKRFERTLNSTKIQIANVIRSIKDAQRHIAEKKF